MTSGETGATERGESGETERRRAVARRTHEQNEIRRFRNRDDLSTSSATLRLISDIVPTTRQVSLSHPSRHLVRYRASRAIGFSRLRIPAHRG
jgi:hypothetical protein